MLKNRLLWAALTMIAGGLQAVDSGALQAGFGAQGLIALGVLLPALALVATAKWEAWVAALVAGAAVLVWARVISLVPLNALHIGALVPGMYIFFVHRLENKTRQGTSPLAEARHR
jgi:hypothetical protein